jgi:hypothetical protein
MFCAAPLGVGSKHCAAYREHKSDTRDIGGLSVRLILADMLGLLLLLCVICEWPPMQHKCFTTNAAGVILLGREAIAKAFGVLLEHVYYLTKGLRMNIDDMACMYSANCWLQVVDKKGSYRVHRPQNNTDRK